MFVEHASLNSAETYMRLLEIVEKPKLANQEKLRLIAQFFNETVVSVQADQETLGLQQECIDALEAENLTLTQANENLIKKHAELVERINILVRQIEVFKQNTTNLNQEKTQLKNQLDGLMQEARRLAIEQDLVKNTNQALSRQIDDLLREKAELNQRVEQLIQAQNQAEEDVERLIQQDEEVLEDQNQMQAQVEQLQNANQNLKDQLDLMEYEQTRLKSDQIADGLSYFQGGCWMTISCLFAAPALPTLVAGAAGYGLARVIHQYDKKNLDTEVQNYLINHPGTSHKKALEKVIEERKKETEREKIRLHEEIFVKRNLTWRNLYDHLMKG